MRSWIEHKPLAGFCMMTLLVVSAPCWGQTVAPSSGKALCSALTADDFTRSGLPVSRLREVNLDDNKSAYCIYDSKTGKVELDIFFPAGDTPAEAQNTERAALSAIGGKFEPVAVAGADEASSNASSPKGSASSIVVRKGSTVFNISIPQDVVSRQRLVKLSQIVISRLHD